jgi:hypothetical protein
MLGDVEMDDPPPIVSKYDEDEEHARAGSGDREEVVRNEIPGMVGKECAPGLGGPGRCLGINRETVRSATSMPGLRNSP